MQKTAIALGAVLASATLIVQASEQMRPGKWEVSQTMEVGGMKMPGRTHSFCVPENNTQDPATIQPMLAGDMPDNCTFDKMEFKGNTASWAVSCTGEDAMQGSGETTMHGDSYEGVMRLKSADGEMTTHMKGRRVGEC